MNCYFSKVIIIGYGQIVNACIEKMKALSDLYDFDLEYIEYENTELSTSVNLCEKLGIKYQKLHEKDKVTNYFINLADKNDNQMLIISAGNFYIFPADVVQKANYTIINFHSALLPKYPGRNAQSWAIYEGEKEAGATWHFVTEELDAGKYIIQKSCEITDNMKAYELTGIIMSRAYEGFEEIIEGVLNNKYDKNESHEIDKERRIYKGKDIPGNGVFKLNDSPEYIYRLLRAMDYGKSDIFPPVKTEVNGNVVRVTTYKMIENDGIEETIIDEKAIYIPVDSSMVLRIKYKSML